MHCVKSVSISLYLVRMRGKCGENAGKMRTRIAPNTDTFECHYLLISPKSVICLDANCSPFQLLNLLPFQIGLKRLKLVYNSLNINFSKYQFKTGTLYLHFLSSHLFIVLEFDKNYFGNLL